VVQIEIGFKNTHMDKAYDPKQNEDSIYQMWEAGSPRYCSGKAGGYFQPKIDPKRKPFTIILPLPNANDPMHMGHALFTVEDILIRFHRMLGEPTLWLPGGDHAGIETQFVFEKRLAKEGKSRFNFDRNTLYQMISDFVDGNRNVNRNQMKRLGFSLDWSRYHYSLEPEIVSRVLETFIKMHHDNLVYRAERMVNYCTKCGTAFSDLEVDHEEREDKLYYLDYGSIKIATARPETIFADVAVAVNPKDKRYQELIGKTATIPLINKSIPIISDEAIKIDFGTGALKVTPAHAEDDFDIGKRHNLPVVNTINRAGRLENVPEKYLGMKIIPARQAVAEDLNNAAKLIKTEPLIHTVSICYRCKTTIEPLLMPQWFIKTKPLAKPAIEAVKKGKTKIAPLPRFKKLYFDWMENIRDWNISRQIVWGPRMPIWYKVDGNEDRIWVTFITKTGELKQGPIAQHISEGYQLNEIENGIQQLSVPISAAKANNPEIFVDINKPTSGRWIQETDTFDTWFLSGQWPINTLKSNPGDFEYFYPTAVLDTLWDILFFWVARMMMFGIYLTGEVPFKVIHLHSRIVDSKGQKMSKSKGNVVNPIEMVDRYGADALRMALIYGSAPGSDIVMSEDKIRGMRNFANKLWNIGRFIKMNFEALPDKGVSVPAYDLKLHQSLKLPSDKQIISELNMLIAGVTKNLEKYRFSDAAQNLYDFAWHRIADVYLEENKERYKAGDKESLMVLTHVFKTIITLLHPFMPFVTEKIYQELPGYDGTPLIISSWPGQVNK
jgi:valyl-tRNA synthetase